jgi:hypothetical protein
MNHSIYKNISRLSLDDELISSINRVDGRLVISTTGGFLENFSEEQVLEPIVADKVSITFTGVRNEIFKTNDGTPTDSLYEVTKPVDFETEYSQIIGSTFSESECLIAVFRRSFIKKPLYYIEWSIEFENVSVQWESFIVDNSLLNSSNL